MRLYPESCTEIDSIDYLSASAKGIPEVSRLLIWEARVDHLPAQLGALICAGDLQGIVTDDALGGASKLLGEVLADELLLVMEALEIAPERTGVILSGDYYSSPRADQRGVSGDVRPVWSAFLERFRWVVGVLGNHDSFGSSSTDFDEFVRQPNLHCLDGTHIEIDGIKVAGISGVIGNPSKPLRRSVDDYLDKLSRLNIAKPDLMILHQSPAVPSQRLIGSEESGDAFQRRAFPLTVCGHVSWEKPIIELGNGNQVLNVDSRVVILTGG